MVIERGNPVCGDRITVQLKLVSDRIEMIRYQAWGCATSLATCNKDASLVVDLVTRSVATTPTHSL